MHTVHTQHHTRGYSLVEVLVAISVLLIATVGPMTIASRGLQSAQFAREQATAIFLAQEGIEAIVADRNNSVLAAIDNGDLDESWDWHTSGNIDRCFTGAGCGVDFNNEDVRNPIVDCGSASCAVRHVSGSAIPYRADGSSANETIYERIIRLEEVGAGTRDKEIKVTATVTWESALYAGIGSQKVELHSSVFNIYE